MREVVQRETDRRPFDRGAGNIGVSPTPGCARIHASSTTATRALTGSVISWAPLNGRQRTAVTAPPWRTTSEYQSRQTAVMRRPVSSTSVTSTGSCGCTSPATAMIAS